MRITCIQKFIDLVRKKNKNINTYFNKEINKLKYIHLPSLETHKKTFEKYKNIYHDRDIVLVASGPTMKYYNSKMLENAIHIGLNHTFLQDNVVLDYLFIQDSLNCTDSTKSIQHEANIYRKGLCKKIYGVHTDYFRISEKDVLEADAERYYFIDQEMPVSQYAMFSSDITTRPLNEWSSVVFAALEFAFWTHPKKIYLVGCDCCSNGHIYNKNEEDFCPEIERLLYGWEKYKQYRDQNYPDVEIISINPIGLKDLFDNAYTQSYFDEHSKTLGENIKII